MSVKTNSPIVVPLTDAERWVRQWQVALLQPQASSFFILRLFVLPESITRVSVSGSVQTLLRVRRLYLCEAVSIAVGCEELLVWSICTEFYCSLSYIPSSLLCSERRSLQLSFLFSGFSEEEPPVTRPVLFCSSAQLSPLHLSASGWA